MLLKAFGYYDETIITNALKRNRALLREWKILITFCPFAAKEIAAWTLLFIYPAFYRAYASPLFCLSHFLRHVYHLFNFPVLSFRLKTIQWMSEAVSRFNIHASIKLFSPIFRWHIWAVLLFRIKLLVSLRQIYPELHVALAVTWTISPSYPSRLLKINPGNYSRRKTAVVYPEN